MGKNLEHICQGGRILNGIVWTATDPEIFPMDEFTMKNYLGHFANLPLCFLSIAG